MVAGVYIASHPWLDSIAKSIGAVGLVKLGHSARLQQRLHDSCYVTCFPGGWTFTKTFECESVADAKRIEGGVLHVYRTQRIDGRELLRTTTELVTQMVQTVASRLGVRVVQRHMPTYALSTAKRHHTSESPILTPDDHMALRNIPILGTKTDNVSKLTW
jgi:hypothetical protein